RLSSMPMSTSVAALRSAPPRHFARAVLLVAFSAACAGCEATPSNGPARSEKVAVTRDLLHAFRDAIRAHYELRLLAEPGYPFKEKPETELEAARESERTARKRLVRAL